MSNRPCAPNIGRLVADYMSYKHRLQRHRHPCAEPTRSRRRALNEYLFGGAGLRPSKGGTVE